MQTVSHPAPIVQQFPAAADAREPVTEPALVGLLCGLARRGAFAVTLDVRTDARARKTGNPHGTIFKRSRVNGFLSWNYGASVNRQRDREGLAADFDAVPRTWGVRLDGTPLVMHKGGVYLELKVERSLGHSYELADGTPINDDDAAPHLPAKRDDAGRQGVERAVILRDYAVSSVLAVAADGHDYRVVRSAGAAVMATAA